jgi:hypothetical protein
MKQNKSLLLFFIFTLFSGELYSQVKDSYGESYLENGVYYSNIKLPVGFRADQVEALNSGLSFEVDLRFSIVNIKSWRFDRTIGEVDQKYLVRYNAFTRRYSVLNSITGRELSSSDLSDIEGYISDVKNLPLIDDSLINIEENYHVYLITYIRAQDVPRWMQSLTFWRENLDTEMEVVEWRLFK